MPAVPAGAFLTEAFLSACRISRVLRAIRSANVGLLLTRAQFNAHGASASDWLISRLMVQHAHLLAMRVSEQLGLSSLQATVVLHWAKAKIGAVATLSDEELLGVVVPKVKSARASFAAVAAEAVAVGRRSLAARLIEHEPDVSRQVPLLLQMGEERPALAKAVMLGDTELIYLLILHLKTRLPSTLFFELLQPYPLAQRLLVIYCRKADAKTLKDYLYHSDQPHEAAVLAAVEGYRAHGWAQRQRGLAVAVQFYEHHASTRREPKYLPPPALDNISGTTAGAAGAGGLYFSPAYSSLMASATSEQIRLLNLQRAIENATVNLNPPPGPLNENVGASLARGHWRFVDQPLNETIYRCFCFRQVMFAEQLRSEFNVPDKRWWRCKVRGLARLRDWDALWAFSQSARRPPIKLSSFAEACFNNDAPAEAARYATRLLPSEAVPVLLRAGQIDSARAVAHQQGEKSRELLAKVDAFVRSAASNLNQEPVRE
mmetsp:Transcript_23856/g.66043  ORF Transcript_23856/g.66043 Transcript_23856/m.66043 type:complete len:488 (-) Transcript_23856:651-2114(-)